MGEFLFFLFGVIVGAIIMFAAVLLAQIPLKKAKKVE